MLEEIILIVSLIFGLVIIALILKLSDVMSNTKTSSINIERPDLITLEGDKNGR